MDVIISTIEPQLCVMNETEALPETWSMLAFDPYE